MTEVLKSDLSSIAKEDLSGALLPWANGSPIYIQSSTPGRYYLPCFETLDQLQAFMLKAKIFEFEVKRIVVGDEFLSSFLNSNITVVLNPTQQEDGHLEVVECHLPGSDRWKLSQC